MLMRLEGFVSFTEFSRNKLNLKKVSWFQLVLVSVESTLSLTQTAWSATCWHFKSDPVVSYKTLKDFQSYRIQQDSVSSLDPPGGEPSNRMPQKPSRIF